jgi:hypothetical protein
VNGFAGIGGGVRKGAQDAPPKKTSRRPPLPALREAIFARAGIVSSVAEALKVDPRTVRRWRDGDPRIQAMFHEAKEAILDLAEAEVVKGIRKGVPSDRYFFLKCHGKHRGWVERQEITGKDGGPIGVPTDEERILRRLSDEDLRRIGEIYEKASLPVRGAEGDGAKVAARVH